MSTKRSKWKFAVDRGGTFTDVVGLDPSGDMHSLKLLSRSPHYEDSSIEGIRRMLGLKTGGLLPEEIIEGIRFGTKVATNALLERKGCSSALLITKGFRDLLEIGYQDRPDIFKLCIKKSAPLYGRVIEVDERIDCRGEVIDALDAGSLSAELTELKKEGIESLGVVLMHSWINPAHENACEEILKEHGYSNIFLSHKTVNLIKIVSRGQSTMVDAYLSTVLARYHEGTGKETGRIPVEFMQSSGLLTSTESFTGKNAILSGPAGGVVAVAEIAGEKGLAAVIGFDMGGTSTDVCRFDGEFERVYERTVAGIPLQTEMLDIITVAAGGGSILNFDGRKMTAGPESAGSYPGPACYGFGGPLTVTDANLLTGRLIPAYFPCTFGAAGKSLLERKVVEEKFLLLAEEINGAMDTAYTVRDVAAGFLRVANEKMAIAIKEISVSRGFDIRSYSLVCFGGAGGQHACSIASLLGIEKVVIHPLSSVMSAYGIGLAMPAAKSTRTVLQVYTKESHDGLSAVFHEMEKALLEERRSCKGPYTTRREIDLRPGSADTYLTIEYKSYDEALLEFRERYSRLFGFSSEDAELEVVNLRVEVVEPAEFLTPYREVNARTDTAPAPDSYHEIYYAEGTEEAPVYTMKSLPMFCRIKGPAFIVDNDFTLIVDPGFTAETDEAGTIILKRRGERHKNTLKDSSVPDPALLEVFNNLFMGIAAEMGLTLQHTAYSVNMKERLDFSCGVFDANGGLVANAPHIPVHLGSMAETVKAVLETHRSTMKRGDVYLTNNPYRGGSHLPDMTVICPVFSADGRIVFFTAARGHHSDVGGVTPGSMPPSACHIDEEGVLIDGFLLVRAGRFREEELRGLLLNHKYPVRNISERIFDFRAQIAACHKGAKELDQLIERYGLPTVLNYMGHIQDNSEYAVKKALHAFLKHGGVFSAGFEDSLDDGTLKAVIDFSGTGAEHADDNLNAPQSVTLSAVMYVLRSLIDADIPMNSGCIKPVEVIIPGGTILSPVFPAPVASGNVETSQRVVDVLLGALGIAAASQGTMNNLLFEVEGESPYYETIAGGAGAMDGCPGASGVQVHMTNTRITDPEILEFRHPGVRLEQFKLRRGSGGGGLFSGGDGVIREIKFMKPAVVSIISERRVRAPYGARGGGPGQKGINQCKHANGDIRDLTHREVLKPAKNDSVIIKTPGGGGFGKVD